MIKVFMKTVSAVLVLTMLLSLLSVSVLATAEGDASAKINIKINDINDNVVNITASAQKDVAIILASYKNNKLVDVKAENNTLTEGTNDYTIEEFQKGDCDKLKAFVWENLNSYSPLCEGFEELQISASGSVAVDGNLPETGVQIQAGNSISANVPQNVVLEENAEALTLTVTTKENSDSNITLGDTDSLLALDVHIEGISKDNTVPITVDLGNALAPYLNKDAISLYHIENGVSVPMTCVDEFTAHNQFKYDPATGGLVLYLATFSEITTVVDTTNTWEGSKDYLWYNTTDKEFVLYNAEQLAGFGAIVGGMAGEIEQDSFDGKTVKLNSDINLGDKDNANENLIFYPIGYYYTDDKNADGTTGDYYSTVNSFEGTFDGNGHTIKNFYHNTWEIKGDYEGNYYKDAMGLFGYIVNGSVKNLTVDNFSSDGEFTPTGVIAAYAVNSTFENIAITNCNPRVYNTGNGGIVGIGGNSDDPDEYKLTFKNITIDNSNKITALWGSWDVACGGLVGMFRGAGHVDMTNCHVAAQMDVYNDVCGNYQYYWYRYAGMMVGTNKNMTTDENGYTVPETSKFHANSCTVHFGEWNDYYYCELVANSLASYTHDHQFSRLEQIESLDEIKSGDTWTKKGNFLLIGDDNTKTCYHIVEKDGVLTQHNHADAGYETVNGETVLKENNQIIYLPFNQLFTGYGWGVKHIPVYDDGKLVFDGITILDREVADSVVKFNAKVANNSYIDNKSSYAVGDLFEKATNESINDSSVMVSITSVDTNEVAGTYTQDSADWTKGEIRFKDGYEGLVKITIQDYQYCTPTTIYVYVVENKILDVIKIFNINNNNTNVGIIKFEDFLKNVVIFNNDAE